MWMTPGCELHLLRGGPAQRVFILADDLETEIANSAQTTYQVESPGVVTVSAGSFTPGAVGETRVLVTFTDPQAPPQTAYIRVFVHQAITGLWIANPQITVRAGSDDYIPSIYAAFDDGPIVDVTGHAYVTVTALPGAPFTIVGSDPLARLHVEVNASGIASIAAQAGGLSTTASVAIAPALSAERRIVERVRYTGEHSTRKNLLFLAEGYPNKEAFDRHVKQIVERMFSSSMYSPFPQLAERFNVWSAFEVWGTGDAGITIGPSITKEGDVYPMRPFSDVGTFYSVDELTVVVGLPDESSPSSVADAKVAWATIPGFVPAGLDQAGFSAWQRQSTLEPSAPKDSIFGAMYGTRRCGPAAPSTLTRYSRISAASVSNAHWDLVQPLDSRSMRIDVRRLPASPDISNHYNPNHPEGVRALFEPYLESLKQRDGTVDDPDFDIGRVWTSAGKDEGLVVLLVYDDVYGGTRFGYPQDGVDHNVAIVIPVGNGNRVGVSSATGPRQHEPSTVNSPVVDQLTTKVAHESAHAFRLGDEYENTDYEKGHEDGQHAAVADIERSLNLMHGKNALDASGNVLADKIKWNWDRITIASELIDIDPPPPDDLDKVVVTLARGQGLKWLTARDQHLGVFLRVRDINSVSPAMRGPFTILNITDDKLTLKGAGVPILTFTAGSVLYLPSAAGRLVHEAVRAYFVGRKPFGINPDVTVPTTQGESPPDIPGLSKPKHRQDVIGVYDGAGTYNTYVLRPAGNCRMRNKDYWTDLSFYWAHGFVPWGREVPRVTQFCFVCRYILVNELSPEVFDYLDREYPEDC